jgi:putative membrane protein
MEWLSLPLVAILATACSTEAGKESAETKSQTPAAAKMSGAADLANQDAKDFIRHVAVVNMAEVDLGQLAANRASADRVKKFAQMMVDDHSTSGEKLKALASELTIDVPGEVDDKHAEQREQLGKRSGADFDGDYMSAMVEGHKDLIDQLEPRIDKTALEQWKAAAAGTTAPTVALLPDTSDNPTTMRINRFAADIYPTVHAHLEAAKELESSLKKRSTTP